MEVMSCLVSLALHLGYRLQGRDAKKILKQRLIEVEYELSLKS